jgi:putative phosphoesterase
MRVAAIYDIHGNLPALEAVLREIRRENVDQIVVGGDVVPGPMARESLELLNALEVPTRFIRGNCEVSALAAMAGHDPGRMPESAKETIRWTARELQSDYKVAFESWPKTLSLEIAGLGRILFCHGTPRDENEIFTKLTPEDRLLPIFENCDADLVICGHTHMQFDRMIGKTRVVNAGSVGMPFGKSGADWLLLGPGVELRHTYYDAAKAAERILATNYRDREEFASKYVLDPPAEKQMLELFTQASLK